MYHPYFRGKQFELLAIRDSADVLAKSGFIPIIEPVKENFNGLEKTLNSICHANGSAIVVINPSYGDHSITGENISTFLKSGFKGNDRINAGILISEKTNESEVLKLLDEHSDHHPCLIHSGYGEPAVLSEKVKGRVSKHIFIEKFCGKLYRRHFKGAERVLISDGFVKRKNSEYPPLEYFSDLHITYPDEGMDGFGDFLIVGDDYSEGGGPAYAVAIHLTYIDNNKDEVMNIYHFISTSNNTPTDPAGKFGQALDKLINLINSSNCMIINTKAILQFKILHAKGHFPGLGTVKKISMNHHIEVMAHFLRGAYDE